MARKFNIMKWYQILGLSLLAILLVSIPFSCTNGASIYDSDSETSSDNYAPQLDSPSVYSELQSGILDPIVIEHTGSSLSSPTRTLRNDVSSIPEYDVFLPSGVAGNSYSAFCDGGYFQVGPTGATDFSSPEGTLSWWGKWDGTAPHGRFWGQHQDFETRWSVNRVVLDFGSDNTLIGFKSDWIADHWYFFAITWNEDEDFLAFYWGDQDSKPIEDVSDSLWTDTVVGLHTENRIMNSEQKNDPVNGNIDDFRYFTTSRTLEDIESDYNCVLSGDESGLSHYYEFENDLSDSTGNDDLNQVATCSFSHDVFRDPNGWRGRQIDLRISELRNLYALNGTFDTGIPGTNQDWLGDGYYHPDGWLARREILDSRGRQRAIYVQDTDNYVVLENEAYFLSPPDRYAHYNGTKIYWTQFVDNSDLNEEFLFNLNYLYQRGPIGSNYEGIFSLRFEVRDGANSLWNWSIDLVNTPLRQQWYSPGPSIVNISNAPSSFEVRLTLDITTPGSSIEILDNNPDLDGDAANAQFITVLLDDISLTGLSYTDPADASLEVHEQGVVSTPIVGEAGYGSVLLNHSYWDASAISLHFYANTNVSFRCTASFSEMYRLHNSSSTTSMNDLGVSYSCTPGYSLDLVLFTYIPAYPEAEHLGLNVHHPIDWENTTILDPFSKDVTNSIIAQLSMDKVPIGIVDSVGWWSVEYNSPNYVKEFDTEGSTDYSSWISKHVFFDGDIIRCNISIGTDSELPTSSGSLEIYWIQPSEGIWHTEAIEEFIGSEYVSTSLTFGPLNASAGSWKVKILWGNGTEIAYDIIDFELHHALGLIAYTPSVDTEVNDSFIITVYLYDLDTGVPILSEDASIIANWSGGYSSLSPNLAQSWWEVELDSTSMAAGQYEISVNASMAFYQNASCTIDAHIMTLTIMTIYSGQQITISPGDNYSSKVRYMYIDGTGIENANVSVLSWSGPSGGLLFGATDAVFGEAGNYSLSFKATISGTYFITIVSVKDGHTTAATSFYLIVKPSSTEIQLEESEIPDIMYYNQTYTIRLFYHTLDGSGIPSATINVTYNPVTIVSWTDVGDGFYEVSLRVPNVGSYAVYLRFQKIGYEYSDISFSLNVESIPTSLSSTGFEEDYYQGLTYDLAIFYNSSLGEGIENADFTILPSIRRFVLKNETGGGWYNLTLVMNSGNWQGRIWLMKEGFVEQEYSFWLNVIEMPIILSNTNPLNQTYSIMENTVLSLTLSPLLATTREILTEATILFYLINPEISQNNIIDYGIFQEKSGVYSANISVPPAGLYVLRITIAKENYASFEQEVIINSEVNPNILFYTTIVAGLIGALIIFSITASVLIGRRFYMKITTARNLELYALKTRLQDSKNLIGFLIIHRITGLPIHSKIIKGGFEDTLLSSFISAISHFRSEFAMDEPVWTVIPLTEMISVVQTESFICAIIAVETPTAGQKLKLEQLSREIGLRFDQDEDFIESVYRGHVPPDSFSGILAQLFDDLFELHLMNTYVGVKKSIPSHLLPVSDAISGSDKGYGVTPEIMINSLTKKGYDERRAYIMVFECIDKGYLIQGPTPLPSLDD